jgi:hypothetical protein
VLVVMMMRGGGRTRGKRGHRGGRNGTFGVVRGGSGRRVGVGEGGCGWSGGFGRGVVGFTGHGAGVVDVEAEERGGKEGMSHGEEIAERERSACCFWKGREGTRE